MLLNLTSILFSLILMFPPGKFVSSCIYKAAGDKVVISFDDAILQKDNELKWTHDKQKVYLRKGSQIKLNQLNVSEDGSLILENIQKDQSGEYKGNIYDVEGNLITETVQQLCVLEPVAEPIVLVECVENGVNLNCSAVNNDEVVVSWMKNGKKANMTHAVLHISSSELKPGYHFSCTVRNQISKKSAKKVEPECSETDNSENKYLFGLDLWWMLVILTGFLLILFIICLVCVSRCCRSSKRKTKREEQHQLVSLMPHYLNQPDDQQKPVTSFG
ncbi:hepatic and glial cell adhesion molecule-like [Carassius carassius]|uniref:hepatic and glial cell adhesion molecule-like n=1 Tax=Carassius carassius TaxID=217509 RepID=UPI002869205B|nr:hepatic and glial cell adhesion molecule-like [Carassius carassius]